MVKLSFLIALAGSIVIIVATALVWIILNQTGVFSQIDSLLKDVTGQNSYSIMDQFSLGRCSGSRSWSASSTWSSGPYSRHRQRPVQPQRADHGRRARGFTNN